MKTLPILTAILSLLLNLLPLAGHAQDSTSCNKVSSHSFSFKTYEDTLLDGTLQVKLKITSLDSQVFHGKVKLTSPEPLAFPIFDETLHY